MIFFKLEKKINYFLLKFLNRINNSRVSFVSCDFLLLIDESQQKNKKKKQKLIRLTVKISFRKQT